MVEKIYEWRRRRRSPFRDLAEVPTFDFGDVDGHLRDGGGGSVVIILWGIGDCSLIIPFIIGSLSASISPFHCSKINKNYRHQSPDLSYITGIYSQISKFPMAGESATMHFYIFS